ILLKYCTDEIMNPNYYRQRFTNSAIDSNMNKEVEYDQYFKYLQLFNNHEQNNINDNRKFVNLIEAYLSNIRECKKEYQAQQANDLENNNNDNDSDKKNT
ncbi:11523_t:CDS:2, partial [Gigaspora margarita]